MNNYEAELIRDQWQRGSGASNPEKVSMNLVDILARELKAWPEGVKALGQACDGTLHLNPRHETCCGHSSHSYTLANDWISGDDVTRDQWQAAVDALAAQDMHEVALGAEPGITAPAEWNGEGLPPVGTVCEFRLFQADRKLFKKKLLDGQKVTIIAHYRSVIGVEVAAFTFDYDEGSSRDVESATSASFRPIRTSEQIEAEERQIAIETLVECLSTNLRIPTPYLWEAAQKIYDAGYRKQ